MSEPGRVHRYPEYAWYITLLIGFALANVATAGDGTLFTLKSSSNAAPRVVSIWGGSMTQLIMESDGSVWGWGANFNGQLGNGTTNNTFIPTRVVGPGGAGYLGPVAAIMGGEMHNFALKPDGTVWCWGNNSFGQLGNATSVSSDTPVQVAGLASVKSLGGRGYHSMAVKTNGTVWAWGRNDHGQLGNGTINTNIPSGTNVPVQVAGLTNPVSLSGGGFLSLALMPDTTVRAWGQNGDGECGDGTTQDRSNPVRTLVLTNIIAISGGWFHALALKADGTVWAWGQNTKGEIGDGTTQNRYIPVQVSNLTSVVSVSAGDKNSMARKSDGTVWKWGWNDVGELGIGSTDTVAHPLPIQVPGLTNVVLSAARDYHNIAVKRDGTVWVWGDNRSGCCGNGSGTNVLSPTKMAGFGPGN